MKKSFTTLSQLLETVESFPWNEAVFLPLDKAWTLQSRVAVASADNLDDDEPEMIQQHGLAYALTVSACQDIVENAKLQKQNPTLDELLEAFLYYYQNDAFITFSRE